MECHTVQFFFPFFPSPVRHCVTEGADIHILSVLERSCDNLERAVGKFFRQADIVYRPGAQAHSVGGDIIVETSADCHCGTSLDRELPVLRLGAEIFSFSNRTGHFKDDVAGFLSQCSFHHLVEFKKVCSSIKNLSLSVFSFISSTVLACSVSTRTSGAICQ